MTITGDLTDGSDAGVTPVGELEVLDCLGDDNYVVVDIARSRLAAEGNDSEACRFRLERLATVWTRWDVCDHRPVGIATPPRKSWRFAMAGLPSEFDRDARNGRQRLSVGKIYYYRGGMQDWPVLGLTTQASAA